MQRRITSILLAALITVILFHLMQLLIDAGTTRPPAAQPVTMLERVVAVEEPPPPPPPPVTKQTAPRQLTPRQASTPAISIAPLEFPTPAAQVPQLDLAIAVSGRLQSPGLVAGVAGGNALGAFAAGAEGFDGKDLVPISSARPRYPRSAAAREIEGWVELIFVITGEGRVENIRILDARPRGIFEDAAVAAMSRWLYPPYRVDGKPVAREATQLFRFRLEDIQDIYLWDD
ncbi:MAG: TonB family protein [Gammaproteobacteria bacterium]|nr:TonB family protein [Gammaproteobacteria bacterium]NNF62079.1 energy transducer TonB [Gammaproteobacteria bacterium]NNM20463.1 energy transducer TonB [Gammaproteobacteria bacterium]